jgi:hypothetical protein
MDMTYQRLQVKIIKKAGDDGDKQPETNTEIKGVQRGEHIVTEEETVAEIGLQVDKRKHKQEIKDKGNNINARQPRQPAQDKKIEEQAVGGKGDKGLNELG